MKTSKPKFIANEDIIYEVSVFTKKWYVAFKHTTLREARQEKKYVNERGFRAKIVKVTRELIEEDIENGN